MVEHLGENNNVVLIGTVVTELQFSHKVYGEGFYTFILEVERLSENTDQIPITISERLLSDVTLDLGKQVEIEGQFRSYNSQTNEGNKLILTTFVRNIRVLDETDDKKNLNRIFLNGFLCKAPVYRTTPFGREITDILLAVNRQYNKSDYIPCVAWGRNARFCETLDIGDNIKIWGRVQSRNYQKKLDNEEVISKIAYEVSISKLEFIENNDK